MPSSWVLAPALLLLFALNAFGAQPPEPFRPRLLSVTLDREAARPGEVIQATYRWQSVGGPSRYDYRVFVHPRLPDLAEGAYPMFGGDYPPNRPVHRWRTGELIVEGPHPIVLPQNPPPGTYQLFVGMFRLDGPRLDLDNPDRLRPGQRYYVTDIRVAADAPQAPSPVAVDLAKPREVDAPEGPPLKAGVTVEGSQVAARLAADAPVPLSLRDKRTGRSLKFAGALPELRIFREAEGDEVWLSEQGGPWTRTEPATDRARYVWKPRLDDKLVGELWVDVSAEGDRLTWRVAHLSEQPGYPIMDLVFPELAAVSAPDGWIAVPHDAGRLLRLGEVGPTRLAWRVETWLVPLGAALIGTRQMAAIVETQSLDDQLEVSVVGDEPRGTAGIALLHRYDAARPELRFVGQTEPSFSLTFLTGENLRWTDAAAKMRSRIATRPNPLYLDRVIFKIFLDSPGSQDYTTFAEALDLIRRVSHLTGGAKMVVYLVGWQYHGHDTGYPSVDVVDERLGGEKGLVDLILQARKYDALVGFHDNYDDAYMDSPAWDPEVICRDPRGDLMKGGVWAGGQSYIISNLRYARKYGLKRVDDTLRRFPIQGSYHIDVLTAVPRRIDWSPESPVSSADNLRGKLMILEEFARHGVDVTSEGFAAPFVGPMRHFRCLMRRPDLHVPGEHRIPLIPFIYHGCVTYGTDPFQAGGIPEAILYGAKFATDWTKHTPDERITEFYYLISLPWIMLNARMMSDYSDDGSVRRVTYSPGTHVEMSTDSRHYEVSVDGRLIARDFATFCPVADGTWRLYSREGGRITWSLPKRWTDSQRISVRALQADGEGQETPFSVVDSQLVVDVSAGVGCQVACRE